MVILLGWDSFKRTCKFNNSTNKKYITINQYTGLSTW